MVIRTKHPFIGCEYSQRQALLFNQGFASKDLHHHLGRNWFFQPPHRLEHHRCTNLIPVCGSLVYIRQLHGKTLPLAYKISLHRRLNKYARPD